MTIASGQVILAADVVAIRDVTDAASAAWTSYVPVWSSSGTAVSLGNGTIVGKYLRVGKTVHCAVKLTMGSTTTYGTGIYYITLPVAAIGVAPRSSGSAYLDDFGTAIKEGVAAVDDVLTKVLFASAAAVVSATTPHTWAVNDSISFSITYEIA